MLAVRLAARSLSAGLPTCVGCSLANSGRPSAIWVRSLSSNGVGTAGVPDVPVTRPEPSPVLGSGTGDLVRGAPAGPKALRLGPVARRLSALWLSIVGRAPAPDAPAGDFGAPGGGEPDAPGDADDSDDNGCVARPSGDDPMPLGEDAANVLPAGPGNAPPIGAALEAPGAADAAPSSGSTALKVLEGRLTGSVETPDFPDTVFALGPLGSRLPLSARILSSTGWLAGVSLSN